MGTPNMVCQKYKNKVLRVQFYSEVQVKFFFFNIICKSWNTFWLCTDTDFSPYVSSSFKGNIIKVLNLTNWPFTSSVWSSWNEDFAGPEAWFDVSFTGSVQMSKQLVLWDFTQVWSLILLLSLCFCVCKTAYSAWLMLLLIIIKKTDFHFFHLKLLWSTYFWSECSRTCN